MKIKEMSCRNYDNFFKRIEKRNMQKNRTSLTWMTMINSNRARSAIIEIYADTKTLIVDIDKLNRLKQEFLED